MSGYNTDQFCLKMSFIPNITGSFLGHYQHNENMEMSNNKIIGLDTPTVGTEAVNKDYVDGLFIGNVGYVNVLDLSVRGVMETNFAATRAANVLTASGNGIFNTVNAGNLDGLTYIAADRILLVGQTTVPDNGVYTITDIGSAGTPAILTRSTDFDTDVEVFNGVIVQVAEGDLRTDTKWVVTSPPGLTVNTDDIVIEELSGQINLTAGTALTLTDREFSVTAGAITTTELDSATALDFWAVPTTSLDLNGQKIIDLGDPTLSQDAATKAYVDSVGTGITVKTACHVATILDLDSTTGSNPPVYVGSPTFTLTAGINENINDRTDTGFVLTSTNRILVKDDSNANVTLNGIWEVTTVGSGAAPWVLTRAADFDSTLDIQVGSLSYVINGDTHGDQQWVVTSPNALPVDIDVDQVVWVLFSGSTDAIIDGDALLFTGRRLDVQVDGTTIQVTTDALNVVAGGITTTELDNATPISFFATATTNVSMGGFDLNNVGKITADQAVFPSSDHSVTGNDVILSLPAGFTNYNVTRTAGAGTTPQIRLPVPVDDNFLIVLGVSVAAATTFDILPPAGGSIYGIGTTAASRIEFGSSGQAIQLMGKGTDYYTLTTGANYIV